MAAGMTSNRRRGGPRRLSRGPRHHFFGYYGFNPWDAAGQHHLALETDFHERPPAPTDIAAVGLIGAADGRFHAVSRTSAFNLQQGSMLHWIDAGRGPELTHNDWDGDEVVSRAVSPSSGSARILGRAIAAVSPIEPVALGLDYGRMYHCRTVVGYANHRAPSPEVPAPVDDGLFRIDLRTGEARLIVSIAEVADAAGVSLERGELAWFNHVLFSSDGRRALFFCRHRRGEGRRTSLWTVAADGSGLDCQLPFGTWISHFAWLDERTLLASCDALGGQRQFVRFTDGERDLRPYAPGRLPEDGHPALSPDGACLVCDTYPHGTDHGADLFAYWPQRDVVQRLFRARSDPRFRGDIRCDLHPRWHPSGRWITFDSVHEDERQLYLLEVPPAPDA